MNWVPSQLVKRSVITDLSHLHACVFIRLVYADLEARQAACAPGDTSDSQRYRQWVAGVSLFEIMLQTFRPWLVVWEYTVTSCVALCARLDFSDFSETFRSILIILDFPGCLKTACFSLLLKLPPCCVQQRTRSKRGCCVCVVTNLGEVPVPVVTSQGALITCCLFEVRALKKFRQANSIEGGFCSPASWRHVLLWSQYFHSAGPFNSN